MMKMTIAELIRRKTQGRKITMLTAYDYPMAKLLDQAGIDVILIGDSLGMVVLGYETTASVTMEEMLHHAKAVRRGVVHALLIGDLPLVALRGSGEEILKQAKRFIEEAGCDGVKIEWKPEIQQAVQAIVSSGIAVVGHVGLTPQTATAVGGWGMRGKDATSAAEIVRQAMQLESVGCCAMVLECVPDQVAAEITRRLRVPTIGIGAGPHCDGQVLVTYDLLGLFDRFTPRFVKRYGDLGSTIRQAASTYREEVTQGRFPASEHTVMMALDEVSKFQEALKR